jgi:hypothetical protein
MITIKIKIKIKAKNCGLGMPRAKIFLRNTVLAGGSTHA